MTTESQLKGWLEADSVSTSTGGPSLIPPWLRDVELCRAMMSRLEELNLKRLSGELPMVFPPSRALISQESPSAPTT